MRQRNIVLLLPHFNTPDQPSSLRSWQMVRHLAAQGHHVVAYAPGVDQRSLEPFPELKGKLYASYSLGENATLIRIRTISNFRSSPIRRLLYDLIYAVLTVLHLLFAPSIDMVIASYPPNILPFLAILLCRVRRIPFIFEVRDLVADALDESKFVKSGLFRRFAQFAEHVVVQHSDHIIPVSPGIKRILIDKGADPNKFTVIPLGYAQEVFDVVEQTFNVRERFGWQTKFVVIYTGALTPAYDLPTLLRAAQRLQQHPAIHIAIVGNGEMRAGYEQFCTTHGLTNCQFIDYQPRRLLPSILAAADVGVHLFRNNPIWSYVLGNKTFDYLASGLPMIYAGTGDTADLIQAAQAGIGVSPEHDEDLANAILLLATQPHLVSRMGENGSQHVRAHYCSSVLISRLDAVVDSLANARGRKQPRSTKTRQQRVLES